MPRTSTRAVDVGAAEFTAPAAKFTSAPSARYPTRYRTSSPASKAYSSSTVLRSKRCGSVVGCRTSTRVPSALLTRRHASASGSSMSVTSGLGRDVVAGTYETAGACPYVPVSHSLGCTAHSTTAKNTTTRCIALSVADAAGENTGDGQSTLLPNAVVSHSRADAWG